VHVNRVLKEFRDNKILIIRDGQVTINDLDRLTERAAPLLDSYERMDAVYAGRHHLEPDKQN
jgi:ribosome maturation factor RimP